MSRLANSALEGLSRVLGRLQQKMQAPLPTLRTLHTLRTHTKPLVSDNVPHDTLKKIYRWPRNVLEEQVRAVFEQVCSLQKENKDLKAALAKLRGARPPTLGPQPPPIQPRNAHPLDLAHERPAKPSGPRGNPLLMVLMPDPELDRAWRKLLAAHPKQRLEDEERARCASNVYDDTNVSADDTTMRNTTSHRAPKFRVPPKLIRSRPPNRP